MSATASVAAFSFRSALSHLRKVCRIPVFSPHLRKVRGDGNRTEMIDFAHSAVSRLKRLAEGRHNRNIQILSDLLVCLLTRYYFVEKETG